MFNCLIDDMYDKWKHLLSDNLDFFQPRFNDYNCAIMERSPGDFAVTNAVSRVGLTIDGTIIEINYYRC